MGWSAEEMEKALDWALAIGDTELYEALLRKKKRLEGEAAAEARVKAVFDSVLTNLEQDFDGIRDVLNSLAPAEEANREAPAEEANREARVKAVFDSVLTNLEQDFDQIRDVLNSLAPAEEANREAPAEEANRQAAPRANFSKLLNFFKGRKAPC